MFLWPRDGYENSFSVIFRKQRRSTFVHDEGNRLVAGDVGSSAEAVLREVQGNDKLLHRVGEAEHRGDQAECRHTPPPGTPGAATMVTPSMNTNGANMAKVGFMPLASMIPIEPSTRQMVSPLRLMVAHSGTTKSGNVVVDVVIICTVQCNRNSRCRRLGAEVR